MKSKAFDHSKYPNWIDPETVLPYERNAKQHTEKQIKNLVNSINRFGWQQDVVITSDNVLVIGHGRRFAALQIGCDMPYHVIDKTADALTDADIRELRIADNQTNAETGMDFSALEAEIEDLSFDGFDFDFGSMFENDTPEDEAPEEYEEQKERKGSMAEKYLVPPFSVIYANRPDWLERKRAWVERGLRSEIGRGGDLLTIQGAIQRRTSYLERERERRGTGESVQEQQPVKQLHEKYQALSTNTIARMRQMKGEVNGRTV